MQLMVLRIPVKGSAMSTYRIDEDILDQKQSSLMICLGVSAFITMIMGAVLLSSFDPRNSSGHSESLLIWFGFLCSLGVSGWFHRAKHFTLASWIYLIGLMIVALYLLWIQGLTPGTTVMFFVPIILS